MKRHKTWYDRKLFKRHFKSYPDWDDFNPPSGEKQPGRYRADAIQCQNPECPREGMLISEHEAFYYAAKKQNPVSKTGAKVVEFIIGEKTEEVLYVCPFCGKKDVAEI